MESGTTDEQKYLPFPLRVFFLVSLACVSPSWLPCLIRSVAPNPRIQRSEFVNSYQQQPVCCLVFSFFILSPSQDLMHCTLSLTVCKCTPCQRASFNSTTDSFSWGHDPYTLACKARPSSDRCWTSLSVSLSLSLSLSWHARFCHSHHKQVRRSFRKENLALQTCSCWPSLLANFWPLSQTVDFTTQQMRIRHIVDARLATRQVKSAVLFWERAPSSSSFPPLPPPPPASARRACSSRAMHRAQTLTACAVGASQDVQSSLKRS